MLFATAMAPFYILTSEARGPRVPISLLFLVFLVTAILMGVKYCLVVVLHFPKD